MTGPVIYTIGGGRQIGKTTLMKQWMADLLQSGVVLKCIAYLTGELIDDHHSLVMLLTETLNEMPIIGVRYLLLDRAWCYHNGVSGDGASEGSGSAEAE